MEINKAPKIDIQNSGLNSGIIVANNSGIINLVQEKVRIPSLISTIVKALGVSCNNEENLNDLIDLSSFKPDDKLEYNRVIKYKDIIKDYSAYYTYCNDTLDIYDNSNLGSKSKILMCVKAWYMMEKGELLLRLKDDKSTDIDKVRNNSDYLIDSVKKKITDIVYTSAEVTSVCAEELELGLICFTCYGFMKCKILEKPK